MDRLQTELAHLVSLMHPHREAWKAYVWDKAKRLAETDKEFADLPARLTAAMKSSATTPEQPSKPKPRTLPETTASL